MTPAPLSSAAEFAPPVPASYLTLGMSALRILGMLVTYENPLLWSLWIGRKNVRADMEGPLYIIGAPSKQIAEGKSIMAKKELLTKYAPYLITVRVMDGDGLPLPGATLDWWQADNEGSYYFMDYTLRGTVKTDSNGYAEVLSVVPGAYGAPGIMRAGHFHVRVRAPPGAQGKWEELTTQIVNFIRKIRVDNMVKSWSIPSATDGRAYMNFPGLSSDDSDNWKRVEWWNAKLAETSDLKVAAGGSSEFRLNAKGWF